MTDAQPDQSPDEQVYQENKREVEVKTVYATEYDTAPDDAAGRVNQDEVSAESFPASDSPATTAAVPGHANNAPDSE